MDYIYGTRCSEQCQGVFYSIYSCWLLSTAGVGGSLSCSCISPSHWVLSPLDSYHFLKINYYLNFIHLLVWIKLISRGSINNDGWINVTVTWFNYLLAASCCDNSSVEGSYALWSMCSSFEKANPKVPRYLLYIIVQFSSAIFTT